MKGWKKAVSRTVIISLVWLVLNPGALAQEFDPYFYLTPLENYSRIGKSLAIRYEAQLWELANNILSELSSERFKLFDRSESPMATRVISASYLWWLAQPVSPAPRL